MRAVIDHHVDRPGVEEEQSLKLTGTNRPIGLIFILFSSMNKLFFGLLFFLGLFVWASDYSEG